MSNKITNHPLGLKVAFAVSAALVVFGGWQFQKGVQGIQKTEQLKLEMQSNEARLAKAKEDVQQLKEKYKDSTDSKAINLSVNGHLLIENIKKAAKAHKVEIDIFLENNQSGGKLDFIEGAEVEYDSQLKIFKLKGVIRYKLYGEFKEFLSLLTERYPIAIKKLSVMGQEAEVEMSIYGV